MYCDYFQRWTIVKIRVCDVWERKWSEKKSIALKPVAVYCHFIFFVDRNYYYVTKITFSFSQQCADVFCTRCGFHRVISIISSTGFLTAILIFFLFPWFLPVFKILSRPLLSICRLPLSLLCVYGSPQMPELFYKSPCVNSVFLFRRLQRAIVSFILRFCSEKLLLCLQSVHLPLLSLFLFGG